VFSNQVTIYRYGIADDNEEKQDDIGIADGHAAEP